MRVYWLDKWEGEEGDGRATERTNSIQGKNEPENPVKIRNRRVREDKPKTAVKSRVCSLALRTSLQDLTPRLSFSKPDSILQLDLGKNLHPLGPDVRPSL